ncbi:hypothetical protein ACQVTS_12295 [Bacillus mycoides]|nr:MULTISPECIES: hypothetical protein [Bacillus cereus group]MBJ8093264.1 hypothetical protein [Bacillus cereus]CAH2466782.1 hypothetical protein ACOSJ1_EBGNOMHC_02107 [Bacillus mycoides KBAB4]
MNGVFMATRIMKASEVVMISVELRKNPVLLFNADLERKKRLREMNSSK